MKTKMQIFEVLYFIFVNSISSSTFPEAQGLTHYYTTAFHQIFHTAQSYASYLWVKTGKKGKSNSKSNSSENPR